MNVVKAKCFTFFYLKDVSDNWDFFHKLGFQFESLLSCEVGLIPPQSPFLEGLGKPGLFTLLRTPMSQPYVLTVCAVLSLEEKQTCQISGDGIHSRTA